MVKRRNKICSTVNLLLILQAETQRFLGRVARHWSAKPATAVRVRQEPQGIKKKD